MPDPVVFQNFRASRVVKWHNLLDRIRSFRPAFPPNAVSKKEEGCRAFVPLRQGDVTFGLAGKDDGITLGLGLQPPNFRQVATPLQIHAEVDGLLGLLVRCKRDRQGKGGGL